MLIEQATVADYRLLQQRIGTRRTVVVPPRVHGTDNSVTLATIQSLDPQHTRGIRFTLYTTAHAATDFSMVEPLAQLAAFVEGMKASGFVAEALKRHRIEGAGVAP